MRVLVLGCGNIGSVAAADLAKSMPTVDVVVADRDLNMAKATVKRIDEKNVSAAQVDASDRRQLAKALDDCDLALGFLPGNLGYKLIETCISERKDLVDVSYMAENPLTLHANAVKADVTVVPDCGLAPGITNILAGNASTKLDAVKSIHVVVGGLPERPVPPLGYMITWSAESLIDEYTRKALIVKNGKRVTVKALTGLEEIEFPSLGRLEAFYTDGLRTLVDTMKGVEEMWEKTLRYPGHAEKIRLIEAMGFFDRKTVKINSVDVSPRAFTAKLFIRKLARPKVRDIVALQVEVEGLIGHEHASHVYRLLDRYDKVHETTAMARTTAYPASIVAQLLLDKHVKQKGIVPPERIGANDELFKRFLNELNKRGVRISEEKTAVQRQ